MELLKVTYGSPQAGEELTRSILGTGFAVVTDHPISADLIFETYREWERFYASNNKHEYEYDPDTYWGYYPFRSENAKGQEQKDLKEFFHVYSWSQLPEGMSDQTRRLFTELSTLAGEFLSWIEANTPRDVQQGFSMPLSQMIEGSERTVFRILHYPPLDDRPTDGAVRASAHEDINLITLLPAATETGLQVLALDGEWIEVACDPASIIVNSGDMLERASNGYFRSTTHRVVNPTDERALKSRYSMPLFLHPRPEVMLSESCTANDYLNERLREIGLREA